VPLAPRNPHDDLKEMFGIAYENRTLPRRPPGVSSTSGHYLDAKDREEDILGLFDQALALLSTKGLDDKMCLDKENNMAIQLTMGHLANLPKDEFNQLKELLTLEKQGPEEQQQLKDIFKLIFKDVLKKANENQLNPMSDAELDAKADKLANDFVAKLSGPGMTPQMAILSLLILLKEIIHEQQKMLGMGVSAKSNNAVNDMPADFMAGSAQKYIDEGMNPAQVLARATDRDTSDSADQSLQENILEKELQNVTAEATEDLITHHLLTIQSSVAFKNVRS
jgi:hypothetical protein